MKIPKISFCVTCMNRFHQIQMTLPQNLKDNRLYKEIVEFVLVDFGSIDGLKEWVMKSFKEELHDGYLKYYYTEGLKIWHASIAKNTAHLLANHDILVNLDCDNYTGYNGGRFIINRFIKWGRNIFTHQYQGHILDGSYGRIGMLREYFYALRGYDESFEPTGYEDTDLIERLSALKLRCIRISDNRYGKAIVNSKTEGIAWTGSSLTWNEMVQRNRAISELNISEERLKANNENWGLMDNIYDIYGNPVVKRK